jgi:hypothetical protein
MLHLEQNSHLFVAGTSSRLFYSISHKLYINYFNRHNAFLIVLNSLLGFAKNINAGQYKGRQSDSGLFTAPPEVLKAKSKGSVLVQVMITKHHETRTDAR